MQHTENIFRSVSSFEKHVQLHEALFKLSFQDVVKYMLIQNFLHTIFQRCFALNVETWKHARKLAN